MGCSAIGWMNGCMDGWMDGWLVGWVDGWMDCWMDGYKYCLFGVIKNSISKTLQFITCSEDNGEC